MTRPLQLAWTAGVLVLAGGLIVLGAVSFVRRASAAAPQVGVQWIAAPDGPVAGRVERDGPAGRAGLAPGDRLVEAGGRPVASLVEALDLGWRARQGEPLEIVTVDPQGARRSLILDVPWRARSEPYGYLAMVGLAFWASGLLMALRWPRLRGSRIYAALAASLFASLVLSASGRGDPLDWWIEGLDLAAAACAPALLLHLGVVLTRRTLAPRRAVVALAYAGSTGLILLAAWLSPALGAAVYRFADPPGALEVWDRVVLAYLGLAVLATVAVLLKAYGRSPSGLHRSQLRWLLWGLAAGVGPFVLLYALPWALSGSAPPAWTQFVAVAPLLLVPAAFTAALARYRLHDLDLLLVRGAAEVGALISTFAVLAGVIYLLREGVRTWLPLSNSATRYIGFLVAAVAYPQIRVGVRVAMDKAFYRKRYSYRTTLLDWARELAAETDLGSLLNNLQARVRETLGLPQAEVLLRLDGDRFERAGTEGSAASLALDPQLIAALERTAQVALDEGRLDALPWARHLFALKVKERLRAVLAVAERASPDEPLTSEDRALLGTLAAHAATAIEAARLVLEVRTRAAEVERLHAREQRILESSAVGLLLLDGEGRIQAWNRALEAIYGLLRHATFGRTLAEIFPLHVARRIERESGVGRSDSRLFRLTLVNRKDQRIAVNVAIAPTEEGGRVVSFDDVTSRVRLEEQLVQQERLAALGLLAAGVAHEINTPLTGISSYAQLLLEQGAPTDAGRDLLEKIDAQTRRASGIANSLLNLARPERTPFELVDLNETVQEVVQLFVPQLRAGSTRLELELAPGLPRILAHRGKMQQVLLNLLSNARDAVAGDGEIRLSTARRDGALVVEVADDGVGIAEEDLPHIFDPFFSTKGRGKGTGLGLSITYGIVQEHEGRIQVESRPGSRTLFRVELPLSASRASLGA